MKCPNCGGQLYYDISSARLKCRSCSSSMEVKDYDTDNKAEELNFDGIRLYTCKNCGAQLICDDSQAVTYCSYCGSEMILESEISGVKAPRYIIPFRITKRQCKQIYKNELSHALYVPREMKDPDFIDRFRPFYIPYWLYKVSFRNDPFELDGYKDYQRGSYDYHEEYKVTASVDEGGLYGVPYDASRNFDDTIAEAIAPFKKGDMRRYRTGYLAGMYADAPNVDAQVYNDEVRAKSAELAFRDLSKRFGNIKIKDPKKISKEDFLQVRSESADTLYLPVWFLTWRKNNRVAYAVVNGQTGRIHVDLPTDMTRFMLITMASAAVLFTLLSLLVSVTSRFVIWFSALLAYLVSRRYYKELKQIRDRENHVFDKGYLISDEDDLAMSEKRRSKLRRKGYISSSASITLVATLCMLAAGLFMSLGLMYDMLVSQEGALVFTLVILILQIPRSLRILNVCRNLKNKRSILFTLIELLAIIFCFAVAVLMPVQDWWYYGGSLVCLTTTTLMATDLISRYNEVSTRPLPSFYERKGGNDREKD